MANNNDLNREKGKDLLGDQDGIEKPITPTCENPKPQANIEATNNGSSPPTPYLSSNAAQPPLKILSWPSKDPENPYNWSKPRKIYVVSVLSLTVLNSTFGSSLPSNATPFPTSSYRAPGTAESVLPISIYLIGYVVGPLFFAPLSEQFGRKGVLISTFAMFSLATMACALAPTWPAFLVFRLLSGVAASAPIAVVGGVYADVYHDPVTRGLAMAVFMAATSIGPLFAPIVSGFVSPALGWRWVFWIALIIAALSFLPLLFIPETYGPVLLARRAARIRIETLNANVFAPFELEKQGFRHLTTVTLTRPIRMLFTELIVAAACMYLSLAYSIFYMAFQSYPLIFGPSPSSIYHLSPGISGLMFLPVSLGALMALPLFIWYDSYLRHAKAGGKKWTLNEESRRLPLACLGGPLYVLSLFWLGWSARQDVHWIIPCLAGVAFGMAFELIFMALLNYLTDAYEIFAASALAAASCSRSVFGAVLPLATGVMYETLGVAWAESLLGFLSLGMCAVPFVFWYWGGQIRTRSRFCTYLKEKRESEENGVGGRGGHGRQRGGEA